MWTISSPLIGYSVERVSPFGLHANHAKRSHRPLLLHKGNAHICSLIPSGGGKSTLLIDNCKTYQHSLICVDVKGELCRNSYHFRRDVLKQNVYAIDPHGILAASGIPASKLDPGMLLHFPGRDLETQGQMIASVLMSDQRRTTNDMYWPMRGEDLLSALLVHMGRDHGNTPPTLDTLVDYVRGEDVEYKMAVLADTKLAKNSFEMAGVASFLSLPDGNGGSTRSCVLSVAQAAVSGLSSAAIRKSMGPSNALSDLMNGTPCTIYLCLPAEYLDGGGQSVVMKLWLETILKALQLRDASKCGSVLVAIDEASLVGHVPAIRTMAVYMRSAKVKLWTFWQDASQLISAWKDYPALLNNCSCVTLSAGTRLAARDAAAMLQLNPSLLYDLKPMEHLVLEGLAEPKTAAIPKWWKDRRFADRGPECSEKPLAAEAEVNSVLIR